MKTEQWCLNTRYIN